MVNAKFETDSGEKREFTGKDLVIAVGVTEHDEQGQICIMTDTDKGVSGITMIAALAELSKHAICKAFADNHKQIVFNLTALMQAIEQYRAEYIERNMTAIIREIAGTGENKDGD